LAGRVILRPCRREMPLFRALLRLRTNWWMWAASTMVPEARVTRRDTVGL
jgi:hypothetical protein